MEKLFWLGLLIAIVVWYVFATVVVAIRGAGNIREMLKTLSTPENNLGKSENKTVD